MFGNDDKKILAAINALNERVATLEVVTMNILEIEQKILDKLSSNIGPAVALEFKLGTPIPK
jgi:hypothetical protein